MPPKKDPVSQLASEESAVNSPVRRSSRLSINAANSAAPAPAPATLRGRRASQTDATTTAKVTKSRRLSQAVDDKDSKEIEVKPAARGRRASLLVEETKQVASPRKNARTTRAVSKSPPTVKEVVKRGRKLSTASDTTETKEEPKTTRAKILATEDAAKTPVKATRGRRSSVSKVEEDEKEPSKVTTRGRRSSVTKEKEDTIVEEPKRVTRGRRSSVDNAEEVPPKPVGRRRKSIADEEISDAPAKSTPIKGRRRPSVTESLSNMDPIIENEENSEKSTIKLTPIKKKVEQAILDPNLSIISENEDTDSPRKLIFQKSAESTDLSEIKTPDKKSPKKLLAEEPRKHSDTDTIVSGTDGSFVFNLNVSIPNSDKTDLNLSEKADLNTSKCSNGSDKENESCKNTPGKKSISADLKESPVVKLQDIMMAANKDQITKSSSIIDPLKEKNVEEREKSMSEDFEFDMPSDNDEAELKMAEKNGEKERPKSPIIQSTRLSSSRRQSVGKTTENNTSIKEKSGRSPSPAREPPGKVVRRSLTHTSPHKMEEVEPMEVDDVFEEQVETDEPNTTTHSINKETNKSSAAFSEGDTFCDMSKLVVEESDLEDGSNLTEEEEEKLLKDPEENDALLAKDHKKSSNVDEKLNEDTINPIKEIKENELNKSASSTENEDQITEHKPNTSLNKTEETTQMDVENEIIEENNQTENNSSNLEETDASFKPRVSIGKEISGKNEERKSRSSLNVSNLLTEKQEIKIKEDQKEYESNTLSKSRLSVNANEEEAVHEKRRSRKISPNAREFKDELVRENRKSRNSLNISKMLPNEVITNGVTEVYNVSTKIENDEVVNLNESKKVAVENKKVSESEENADQDKSEIKNNGLYKNHDEVPCDNQKSEEKFDTSTKSSQNINLEKPENEDKTTENGLDDSHEELSDNVSSLSSESPSSKSKESEKKINISTKSRVGIYLDEPENEEKYLNDQRKPIKILNNLKSNSSEEVSDDNEDESTSFKINESEDPKENEIKSTKEFNKNGLDESRDISADEIDLNESKSLGNKFTEEISENEEEPKVNGLDASLEEIVDKQISPEKRKSKSRNSLNTSKLSFKNEEEPKVNGLDDNQGEDKPQPRSPEKQNKKSRNNLNTSKLSSKNKEVNELDDDQEDYEDNEDTQEQKSPEKEKRKSGNSLNTSKLSSKNKEVNELDDDQEDDENNEDAQEQKSPDKEKKKSGNSLNTSKLSSKNKEVNELDDDQEDDEDNEDTQEQKSPEKENRKSGNSLNTRLSSENKEDTKVNGLDGDEEDEDNEDTLQQKSPEKKVRKSRNSLNASQISSKNDGEPEVNEVKNNQTDEDMEDEPQHKSPKREKRKSRSSLNASKLSSNTNNDNPHKDVKENKVQKYSPSKQSKLQQLEDFANSKVDEYLQMKSIDSDEEEISSEDDDYDPAEDCNRHEFIDDMAEECEEEESEYDDSNDIPCDGESIGSTEDENNSSDEYDEDDSFICDEEYNELISGDEYDLDDQKKIKTKSRIVTVSDSSNDEELDSDAERRVENKKDKKYRVIKGDNGEIIKIESKKKKVEKTPKISRIISVDDSSDDEELEKMRNEVENPIEVLDNSDFVNEVSYEETTPKEQIKNPAVANFAEASLNDSGSRRASVTIHENIRIDDLKDAALSERINLVVESFCSTVQKGEISMNLSLQYDDSPSVKKDNDTSFAMDYKPDTTNVEKKSPSPKKRKSTSESETSFEKRTRTSLESTEQLPSTSKLNTSLENMKKKKNIKSKMLEVIPVEKTKTKKKKGTKLEITTHELDDLRVDTFSLMNQEIITDIKNRKRRMIKPSMSDTNSSWISEKQPVIKPSTSQVTKAEKLQSVQQKVHPKDFKNQMLYNKSRVNRVETKTLLKKKGVFN